MEPEGGEDPGPRRAAHVPPGLAEIERLLDAALASVPGAVGVNNHMGSKATADAAFMDVLLDALGRRGLFFVDSRTTVLTVAASEAERLGVPYLARKVFLDAVDGDIERSLDAGDRRLRPRRLRRGDRSCTERCARGYSAARNGRHGPVAACGRRRSPR